MTHQISLARNKHKTASSLRLHVQADSFLEIAFSAKTALHATLIRSRSVKESLEVVAKEATKLFRILRHISAKTARDAKLLFRNDAYNRRLDDIRRMSSMYRT